eukprot:3618778-Rhodomonas_salina.1
MPHVTIVEQLENGPQGDNVRQGITPRPVPFTSPVSRARPASARPKPAYRFDVSKPPPARRPLSGGGFTTRPQPLPQRSPITWTPPDPFRKLMVKGLESPLNQHPSSPSEQKSGHWGFGKLSDVWKPRGATDAQSPLKRRYVLAKEQENAPSPRIPKSDVAAAVRSPRPATAPTRSPQTPSAGNTPRGAGAGNGGAGFPRLKSPTGDLGAWEGDEKDRPDELRLFCNSLDGDEIVVGNDRTPRSVSKVVEQKVEAGALDKRKRPCTARPPFVHPHREDNPATEAVFVFPLTLQLLRAVQPPDNKSAAQPRPPQAPQPYPVNAFKFRKQREP